MSAQLKLAREKYLKKSIWKIFFNIIGTQMNNIQYNILFLLTAMPYISLTMNDPRQGRSLDNTRRLLLGDSVSKPTFSEGKKGSLLVLMSELPTMPNKQEKKRRKTKDSKYDPILIHESLELISNMS